MVKAGPEPLFVQEYTGRWFFLEALQIEDREFWSELQDLRKQSEDTVIVNWMTRTGVIDAWFIEIIWDTVHLWSDHPSSASAQLAPGCRWFRYSLLEDGQVRFPIFAPQFSPPSPDGSSGNMESPDQFASRTRSEFESQLKEYVRYLRSVTGEDHTELRKHAQWAAMAFAGLSYVHIADQFKHLRTSLQPDMTVKMAVRRFSERIGLTLPGRRRRLT